MSDDWKDFVHTGPGTLAGRYLRSFWQPIYVGEELAPGRAVPLRIMSEDFTLFRGESGTPHTVEARCAHRRTPLHMGWVEEDCIRCRYHGWKYDGTGQCVEQPGELESFAKKVQITSYPTQEYLGLIWAYLGEGAPPPMRRLPDMEKPGVLSVGPAEPWPCNFFNGLDNARDAAHVAFTHHESTKREGTGDPNTKFPVPEITFVETEYGIRESVKFEGKAISYTHFHMPNINQIRAGTRIEGSIKDPRKMWADRLLIRVPVDDENFVRFVVSLLPLTGEEAEEYLRGRSKVRSGLKVTPGEVADAILAGKMRLEDVDPDLSTYYLFWIEDYVVQVGPGVIPDRSKEHLGRMDEGVILLRGLWQREMRAIAEGRPTKEWFAPEGLADMSEEVLWSKR